MIHKPSSTPSAPSQDELKKVEEALDAFNTELERTLPPGLNSRLTRSERALLRTFSLWALRAPLFSELIEQDKPVEDR